MKSFLVKSLALAGVVGAMTISGTFEHGFAFVDDTPPTPIDHAPIGDDWGTPIAGTGDCYEDRPDVGCAGVDVSCFGPSDLPVGWLCGYQILYYNTPINIVRRVATGVKATGTPVWHACFRSGSCWVEVYPDGSKGCSSIMALFWRETVEIGNEPCVTPPPPPPEEEEEVEIID